jgi:hypothetical protein
VIRMLFVSGSLSDPRAVAVSYALVCWGAGCHVDKDNARVAARLRSLTPLSLRGGFSFVLTVCNAFSAALSSCGPRTPLMLLCPCSCSLPAIDRNPGVAHGAQGVSPDSAKRIAQDTMKLCVRPCALAFVAPLLFLSIQCRIEHVHALA